MWHHRLTNCTNCAARVNTTTGKPSPVTPTARWNKKYYKKFVIKIKLILVLSLLALPGSVAAPAWKQGWRLIIQWRPRLMSKSYFGAKKRRVVFDKKSKLTNSKNVLSTMGDFWSDINIQERYEETSGNILLTLRSITQKPLQYFLDNKDFTKVRNIFPRKLKK